MRVVAFGTYDAHVHPRGAVLIAGLQERGFDVVEINERLAVDTDARVAALENPWLLPRVVGRVLVCWARLVARSVSAPRADVVLVPYLGHFDVLLARVRWPRRTIVLDHLVSAEGTARDRRETGRVKLGLLRLVDHLALSAADVIVVDTAESAERLPDRYRPRAVVVPVGATHEWFEARHDAADSTDGTLKVVFFGSFSPLQGTTTIARALTMVDEGLLTVTLVGHGQDHEEVRAMVGDRSDVVWHSWIPIDELPRLVAEQDVCLGIFGGTDKALTVVPTKVFQGAAAGCAVVTSDTPPQRRELQDCAAYVPASDPVALAETLVALAGDPARVVGLKARSVSAAEAFRPARVVDSLLNQLELQTGDV
jgi:glycosyltransferase involved in cell wall biosynthesis